ncbi:MAG: hypothetical protein AB7K09_18580 [Planctomycetota bacterium]
MAYRWIEIVRREFFLNGKPDKTGPLEPPNSRNFKDDYRVDTPRARDNPEYQHGFIGDQSSASKGDAPGIWVPQNTPDLASYFGYPAGFPVANVELDFYWFFEAFLICVDDNSVVQSVSFMCKFNITRRDATVTTSVSGTPPSYGDGPTHAFKQMFGGEGGAFKFNGNPPNWGARRQ